MKSGFTQSSITHMTLMFNCHINIFELYCVYSIVLNGATFCVLTITERCLFVQKQKRAQRKVFAHSAVGLSSEFGHLFRPVDEFDRPTAMSNARKSKLFTSFQFDVLDTEYLLHEITIYNVFPIVEPQLSLCLIDPTKTHFLRWLQRQPTKTRDS